MKLKILLALLSHFTISVSNSIGEGSEGYNDFLKFLNKNEDRYREIFRNGTKTLDIYKADFLENYEKLCLEYEEFFNKVNRDELKSAVNLNEAVKHINNLFNAQIPENDLMQKQIKEFLRMHSESKLVCHSTIFSYTMNESSKALEKIEKIQEDCLANNCDKETLQQLDVILQVVEQFIHKRKWLMEDFSKSLGNEAKRLDKTIEPNTLFLFYIGIANMENHFDYTTDLNHKQMKITQELRDYISRRSEAFKQDLGELTEDAHGILTRLEESFNPQPIAKTALELALSVLTNSENVISGNLKPIKANDYKKEVPVLNGQVLSEYEKREIEKLKDDTSGNVIETPDQSEQQTNSRLNSNLHDKTIDDQLKHVEQIKQSQLQNRGRNFEL